MKNKNFIIAEFNIKENEINKDIRIINSFEEVKRKNKSFEDIEDYYKYENEKEIKDNCKIKINNEIIPFSYFYKFNNKGKYKIIYEFKDKLKKIDYMFYGCDSLMNIDLSNFNTQNANNMSYMFNGCNSLTNLDLSNFNKQNVTNMSWMFSECNKITNINNIFSIKIR